MTTGLQRAFAAARATRHKHPCAGLSKAPREVFERIAINQPPHAHPNTLATLIKRGLIEQTGTQILGRDRFGTIRIPIYAVPLAVHYQWCRWCGENVKEPE